MSIALTLVPLGTKLLELPAQFQIGSPGTLEAGTENEPDTFSVPFQKKGWKIDPQVST